jgi:hypothetical protein
MQHLLRNYDFSVKNITTKKSKRVKKEKLKNICFKNEKKYFFCGSGSSGNGIVFDWIRINGKVMTAYFCNLVIALEKVYHPKL